MLTLRVCLARDLPQVPAMDANFIYFAYDRLKMFMGNKGEYQGNYAIVPSLPDEMSPEIMYILTTDGSVNIWYDYQVRKIAEIEDASQIELLRKASTSFFHYASHRYLDMTRRVINLPYENGQYELVVDIPENIIVNDDTVLRYDVEQERFIEEGDEEIHTPYIGLHGSETDTVILEVVNERMLKANVKISDDPRNAIVVNKDGLYIDGSRFLKADDYNAWIEEWGSTQRNILDAIDYIESELEDIRDLISEESITAKINEILEGRFPTIQEAIDNYDQIVNVTLPAWMDEVKEYSDELFADTKNTIIDHFENYFNEPWEDETPKPEPEPEEDEEEPALMSSTPPADSPVEEEVEEEPSEEPAEIEESEPKAEDEDEDKEE